MTAEIEISLSQTVLRAAPGGPEAEASAVVRNLSSVVDQLTLSLDGVDDSWWQVVPSTVSLFPGDEATVAIRVAAPSGATAGDMDLVLRAVSGDNPARTATATLRIQVGEAGAVSMSIEPASRTGRSGKYAITVKNTGNAERQLTLAGVEESEALEFAFEPAALVVAPFSQTTTALEVKPKSRPLTGKPREHAFTVRGMPAAGDEPLCETQGDLTYKPMVGTLGVPAGKWKWLLALIPLMLFALLVRAALNESSDQQAKADAGATATAFALVKPPTPPVAPPVAARTDGPMIISLSAKRAGEDLPRTVMVSWEVEKSESAKGQMSGIDYGPIGEPSRKGDYNLQATGGGGGAADNVRVVALGPPIIKQYFVRLPQTPESGLRLEYEVAGADVVDVEGSKVDPNRGSLDAAAFGQDPAQRGVILKATNAVGSVSSIVYFKLPPGATPVPTPTETPTPIPTKAPADSVLSPTSTPTGTPAPVGPTETPAPAVDVPTGTPTPIILTDTPTPVIPTDTPTATPVIPTDTPTATPAPPTNTATPLPACVVDSFSISPQSAFTPFMGQPVGFKWATTNTAGINITWTDDGGQHQYLGSPDGGTTQNVTKRGAGTVTFNLVGYKPGTTYAVGAGVVGEVCVGPVSQTLTVNSPPTATPTPTIGIIIKPLPSIVIRIPTATPTRDTRIR